MVTTSNALPMFKPRRWHMWERTGAGVDRNPMPHPALVRAHRVAFWRGWWVGLLSGAGGAIVGVMIVARYVLKGAGF